MLSILQKKNAKEEKYTEHGVCTSESASSRTVSAKVVITFQEDNKVGQTSRQWVAVAADKDVAAETPGNNLRESQQKERKFFFEQVHGFRPENL